MYWRDYMHPRNLSHEMLEDHLSMTIEPLKRFLAIRFSITCALNKHATMQHSFDYFFSPYLYSCEIPMGDLQSEEERDIVLELKLPALPSPTQDTVLRSTLSYFNVISSELDTIQSELVLSRGGKMMVPALYFYSACMSTIIIYLSMIILATCFRWR